jgi:hypothetical protein
MSLVRTVSTFGRPAAAVPLSYAPAPAAAPGDGSDPALIESHTESQSRGGGWVGPVLVVGILGIVGYAMWSNYQIVSGIAKKEGSLGVLKYEGGTAAIGVASNAANKWIDD